MIAGSDQRAHIEGFFAAEQLRGYDTADLQQLAAMTLATYAVNAEGLRLTSGYVSELTNDSQLEINNMAAYQAVADRRAGTNLDRLARLLGDNIIRVNAYIDGGTPIRDHSYRPLPIAWGRLDFRHRRPGQALGGGPDLQTIRLHRWHKGYYDVRPLDDELLPTVHLEVLPSNRQRLNDLAERVLERLQIAV